VTHPLITFTSDFGHDDWFVGVVHGVIHDVCPACRVVDLTHTLPPGAIAHGAFTLEAAAPDFPDGTVHLAVVDPGVGTARRALGVRARRQWFVGPDNGLLEWALADPQAEVRSLTEERLFRHPVSRTFHGRDVFAPVAAHLASGVAFDQFGPVVRDPVRLESPEARLVGGTLHGRIMHIDRFGNALTNVDAGALARAFPGLSEGDLAIDAGGRRFAGVTRSYGDAPVGTVVVVLGSSGRLEIAQVGGAAAERLGLGVGDQLLVTRR